jgi:hypothetical protein
MTAEMAKQPDREQLGENINTLRIAGGLMLMMGLLLYFFHLAEAPMGRYGMAVLALLFAAVGAALLWVGWRRLRALR